MSVPTESDLMLMGELETLRQRLMELEELEVQRVTEEQERFSSLQVLDEYAKQLEESRDKLARLFRAGAAVQEARTIKEILERTAQAVGESGWGSASVNVFQDWDVILSAYYGVSQEDIEYLHTHRKPPAQRAKLFGPDVERFKISRSYYVPAQHVGEVTRQDEVVPGRRPVQTGDTWDPMDLAYVPLYGSDGRVLGVINCDDPLDGKAPTAETFVYLELFADLAARQIETTMLSEQRHKMEEALRQSEVKYRTIFDRSGDGFFLMDELFRDCNRKACELWACDPEDIIGHSPVEFSPEFQPDGRPSTESAAERIAAAMAGNPQVFYWMHKRKDGTLMDCEVSLASLNLENQNKIMAIVRDISDRKRSELEQEVVLRILQIGTTSDSQDEMIRGIFDQIGRLVPVENYFLALHDPQSNMLSFPIFVDEVDPPPKPRPFGNALTEWVIRHGEPLCLNPKSYAEMERRGEAKVHGTPALSWLGVPLVSQSKPFGALVVQSYRTENLFTDYHVRIFSTVAAQISAVIDRKRSEEALRFTQATVDSAADSIFWIAADGQIIYVNDVACRSLDYEKKELLQATICEVDPHYTPANWEDHWHELRKCGIARLESTQIARDGRLVPVEITVNCVRLAGNEVICMSARDVSERKQAEQALSASQENLRWLVQSVDVPVGITDPQEYFLFANDSAAALFGVPHDELVGRNLSEFMDPESFEFIRSQTRKRYQGVRSCYDLVIRKPDCTSTRVQVIAAPQLDRAGRLQSVVAIMRPAPEVPPDRA